jgi:DDE superfamily endonuclease
MTWPHTIIEKRASYYSKCVYKNGSSLLDVVDFIDGTAIEIARPGGLRQRASYSGHKRRNCVNFQAVSAPDGLILPLYGPIEGRRHDMTLYRESKIDSIIQSSMNVLGVEYCLYGALRIVFGLTFKLVSRGPISQETRSNSIHTCPKFELQLSGLFEISKCISHVLTCLENLKMGVTTAGLWYVCSAVWYSASSGEGRDETV